MKCTEINQAIQRVLHNVLKKFPLLMSVAHKVAARGGRTLLVGGAVRDLLLNLSIKDVDVEVHGVSLQELETILKQQAQPRVVDVVGKSFGVLKVYGLDIDWALPRTDSSGRKPEVLVDPHMPIKQAFARRDLTMNALGIDLISNELLDPFGGQRDIENKLLRATDPQFFIEDPLRFFRVMHFVGRFEFDPDDELSSVCKKMDVSQVSVERIEKECEKLLLQSQQPSRGFRWLQKIDRLKDIFPELNALITTPQNPDWHPEGNVFEHTMQALDAAAVLKYDSEKEKLVLLYAALCHDLGKAITTEKVDGVYKSYGHAQEGVKLSKQLLKRIMRNKEIITQVATLVRHHMTPGQLVDSYAKSSAYKRLARKVAPISLQQLANLFCVDRQGRNPDGGKPFSKVDKEVETFRANAQQAGVFIDAEKPVLRGRDILDVVEPGARMGELLQRAYQIQLEEGIKDIKVLKHRVLTNF